MSARVKFLLALSAVLALAGLVRAEDDDAVRGPAFAESVLRRNADAVARQARLRRIDEQAFRYSNRFADGEHAPPPGPGPDGRLQIVYGASQVKVFCLVQRICDIALQKGEALTKKPMASNQSEWSTDYGEAAGQVHVAIKPKVPDSESSLVIYTDRRVYYLELASSTDAKQHTPLVGFLYEDDGESEWTRRMQVEGPGAPHREPESQEYEVETSPENVHFGYEIEKEGRRRVRNRIRWAPTKVFDDGHKTFIKMPDAMLDRESPNLVVANADGTASVVNYRAKGAMLIVDELFDEALLTIGVGRNQERVRITRLEEEED